MANAGNSSDNRLAIAITRGLWTNTTGKWVKLPNKKIPEHKDEDDIHQTALKNMLIDYYNVFYNDLENTSNNWRNTKIRRLDKIIYRMNQYRQKHWYWKAII